MNERGNRALLEITERKTVGPHNPPNPDLVYRGKRRSRLFPTGRGFGATGHIKLRHKRLGECFPLTGDAIMKSGYFQMKHGNAAIKSFRGSGVHFHARRIRCHGNIIPLDVETPGLAVDP